MKVFRVAADSSCLIGLAQIDLLRLLKELFPEVHIPDAVYDEVAIRGVLGVIDLAIEKGILIDKKKVFAHLKELGFRISDKLLKKMFPDSE